MDFDEFIEINLEEWNKFFEFIFCLFSERVWRLRTGILLYPNIALFVESDDHYILELFGATTKFNGLEKKIHRLPSTLGYLNQFGTIEGPPIFDLGGRNIGFKGGLFTRSPDIAAVE